MIDPVQSFSDMLRKTLGERLQPDAKTFVAMFAEDGVMEFLTLSRVPGVSKDAKPLPLISAFLRAESNFSACPTSLNMRRATQTFTLSSLRALDVAWRRVNPSNSATSR
jgi:hypothetical protein